MPSKIDKNKVVNRGLNDCEDNLFFGKDDLYSAGYKFADVWSDVTTMILAPFICTLDGPIWLYLPTRSSKH